MNLGSSVTFCTDIKPITKSLFSCAIVTAAVMKMTSLYRGASVCVNVKIQGI